MFIFGFESLKYGRTYARSLQNMIFNVRHNRIQPLNKAINIEKVNIPTTIDILFMLFIPFIQIPNKHTEIHDIIIICNTLYNVLF